MNDKKVSRLRRAKRGRMKMKSLGVNRLSVSRTSQHTYAQILSPAGDKVLASASTLEKGLGIESHKGNTEAAQTIGRVIAERAKEAGIETVAFDRSGFKYHGRVKALADSARESGLKF